MEQSKGPITMSGPGWVKSSAFRTMRVSEAMSEPFAYELEILSELDQLKPNDVLGHPLTISVEVGDKKRHYNAFVTSVLQAGTEGRYHLYRLMLRPWLWFLSRSTNCRIFQNKNIIEIVKAVAKEYGFSEFELRINNFPQTREYVVQYRETDLHFVRRLLEEEGIYFYFSHSESEHLMVLCDSSAAHDKTEFHEEVMYLPPGGRVEGLLPFVDGWQVQHDVETGHYALGDYDFEDPEANLVVDRRDPRTHPHGAYEVFDFPGGYKKPKPGEAIARMRLEEIQTGQSRMQGHTNARGLVVGQQFKLSEHPQKHHNGEYLVTAMNGTLDSHGLESGHAFAGDIFRGTFSVIGAQQTFRPRRITRKPVVHGAQTAKVVGPKGEEIWTDKYGRVKLQFRWDRYSPGNEDSSCWVRVAQIWAGPKFGAMFIPRIGQEVVVEFLEGDPDQPLITGRVYNADNMPPYKLPNNHTQSGIKSRSTKRGGEDNANEIRFEDKKGNEDFFMQAEKNQTIKVKNNRSASIGAADSISVGASRSVSVTDNLSVTVGTGGAAESTLNVTGTHRVDTTDTIDAQAPNHIKLTCGGSFIELTPDKIVISAGGGSQVVLDANAFMQASGKAAVLLDGNVLAESSGMSKIVLDANALMQSSAQSQLLLDEKAQLTSLTDVELGGLNINGEGMMQVTFTGGAGTAQSNLGPQGADLQGPMVNLNGMATVGVMAPTIKIG